LQQIAVNLLQKLIHCRKTCNALSLFPGVPGLAGTIMSPLWILFEVRMMEVVSGNWSCKTSEAPAKLSTQQTDKQLFTGRIPFL